MGLLHEIVTPVGQVEASENGGKYDSRQDVDFFGPRWELVQPENRYFDVSLEN